MFTQKDKEALQQNTFTETQKNDIVNEYMSIDSNEVNAILGTKINTEKMFILYISKKYPEYKHLCNWKNIGPIIKQIEADYQEALNETIAMCVKETPKTEKDLKDLLIEGNRAYFDSIMERTGGFERIQTIAKEVTDKEPVGENVGENVGKPIEEPIEEPVEKPVEEPVVKTINKPIGKIGE